jgi:hypothetical protein
MIKKLIMSFMTVATLACVSYGKDIDVAYPKNREINREEQGNQGESYQSFSNQKNSFSERLEIEDQPSRPWRRGFYYSGQLMKSAAVGWGMMTVYAQAVEESGIRLNSAVLPVMISSGSFYALKSFLTPFFVEKNQDAPWLWKGYSAFNALLPVSFLLNAELAHHRALGNEGWDIYFSYFMALAPFILWNDYQENSANGRRFFLNREGQSIQAVTQKSDDQYIEDIYENMEEKGYYLPLRPSQMARSQSPYGLVASWGFSVVNLPLTFFIYKSLLEMSLGEEAAAYGLAAIPTFATFFIQQKIYYEERIDAFLLIGLVTGLFEAFPFLAHGYSATEDFNPWIRYPLLFLFGLGKSAEKGAWMGTLVKNALYRSCLFRNKPQQKRFLLKDKLQALFA